MSLLLPTRRQKQPQGPVKIDWSHPLAKGLTGLWIFNTALPTNLVNGKRSTILIGNTSNSIRSSKGGKYAISSAIRHNLVSTQEELFDLPNAVGSILIVHDGNGTCYAGRRSGGSGTRTGTLMADNVFDFGTRIEVMRPTSSKITVTSAVTSGNSGFIKAFQDGVLLRSGAKAASVPSVGEFYVGQIDSTTTSSTARTHAVATWNRELTEKQVREASRNIYQLLKPITPIRVVDLSIFNIINLDASITGPAPLLDANFEQLSAGTIAISASLPAPAPALSADIDTGKAITASLPAPAPQLDGFFGQFTAVNASLRLSAPSLEASLIGGTVISASLAGSSASITGEIVHGIVAQANLSAPTPVLDANIAPQVELPAPAPRLNASFVIGIVANGTLTSPEPRLNAALSDDRTMRAELPAPAPSITGSFVFNQVINADLPAPAPRITANMHMGLAIQAVLTAPAPKLDAEFGSNAIIAGSLPSPSPRLQANFTMPKPAATFYNRWTR